MNGWSDLGGLGGLGDFGGLDGLNNYDTVDGGGVVPDGHLVLDIAGVSYGLPASHDLGEGATEEAVTLTDDRGMAVCADTDGDGHVDRVSVVGFDGSWSAWERRRDAGTGPPADAPAQGAIPPVTPGAPTDNWRADGWECVQRGEWG